MRDFREWLRAVASRFHTVEHAEAKIAVLKRPVPHKYELIRMKEKK